MEKVICTDNGNSDLLEVGKEYFMLGERSGWAYISHFPKQSTYFGVYEAKRFTVLGEEPPSVDHEHLDREKIYQAELIYCRRYPVKLKNYYVKPRVTHANFYVDPDCLDFCGCFPLHWFANFIEHGEQRAETPENGHSEEITPEEYQGKVQEEKHDIELFERPDGQLTFF